MRNPYVCTEKLEGSAAVRGHPRLGPRAGLAAGGTAQRRQGDRLVGEEVSLMSAMGATRGSGQLSMHKQAIGTVSTWWSAPLACVLHCSVGESATGPPEKATVTVLPAPLPEASM